MYGAFTYWHAYYDSAFLSHPFKLSEGLYQDLQITSTHIQRWPSLPELPSLPNLFQLLEAFLLDEINWTGCLCSDDQMSRIQKEINRLIIHLQCEKRYGFQFWQKSKIRIQASIVHFTIFLKRLALIIIPQDCKNILQANKLQKLTIQISRLQYLINEIIKRIKQIYLFLFNNYFSQEIQLIKQCFQEFNIFLQKLPNYKKQQLSKIPKLMNYICLNNSLEAVQQQPQIHQNIRRKNATTYQQPKSIKKYSLEKQTNHKKNKIINNNILKINHKKYSLDKNIIHHQNKHHQKNNLQFFKFNQSVRKSSIYRKTKKQTVASLQTKEKHSSVEKQRSPTHDRSMTIFGNESKKKTQTFANINRNKQQSVFVDPRPRELTTKSRVSRKSIKKTQNLQGEQIEHERQQKTKKKKPLKLPIKTSTYSEQHNFTDGKLKGWGIIRQYINKRVAQKKMKKILLI